MADPFVAEIRMFGFNFPPTGWAFCNGQLMPISQNAALFSLLGTTYGGDGKSTYALPNMMGNAPMHPGQGPGLSLHDLGETDGSSTVTVLLTQLPSHTHAVESVAIPGNVNAPSPQVSLARSHDATAYQSVTNLNLVQLSGSMVGLTGGSQPHNNLMPYLAVNFCIALRGVFPPRG